MTGFEKETRSDLRLSSAHRHGGGGRREGIILSVTINIFSAVGAAAEGGGATQRRESQGEEVILGSLSSKCSLSATLTYVYHY